MRLSAGPRTVHVNANWRAICAIATFSLALAFLVFRYGGVLSPDWNIAACGIAAMAIILALSPVQTKPAVLEPGRPIAWSLVLLCAYIVFQTIPLPATLVGVLSPGRFELASASRILGAPPRFFSLSVFPSATLAELSNFLCYALVFVSIYNLARRMSRPAWLLILPLVLLGVGEAIFGILQATLGGIPHFAHGTYINKNHFAGFLEMIVAFPLAYGWQQRGSGMRVQCAALAMALIIAAAVAISTSRSGIIAAALAILLTIVLMGATRPVFYLAGAAGTVALVAAILFLFPIEAVDSVRPAIWRDTLHLIRAFPITGSGFGTFETAMYRYKTAAPLYTVDYAHNDYMQLLAELGAAGFLMLIVIASAVVRRTIATLRTARTPDQKALVSAGLGAFAAIALHSLTDFNLYIPANAMTLAWIAAVVLAAGDRAGAAINEC